MKTLANIIIVLISMAGAYGCVGFVLMEWNLVFWSPWARLVYLLLAIMLAPTGFFISVKRRKP